MTSLSITEWSLPAWAVLAVGALVVSLVVLSVALAVAQARSRRQARTAVTSLEARLRDLQDRVDGLSRPQAGHAPGVASATEYVITSLGELGPLPAESAADAPATLPPSAFADAVLRESVVHTASFLHGVRHALSAQTRNRIRFEMRRELKRSRKERKVELREALREYRARHRAEVPVDAEAHVDVPPGVTAGVAAGEPLRVGDGAA